VTIVSSGIVNGGVVNSAAVAGQPARPVVRRLRQGGLRVRVEWAPAPGPVQAGTIISVSPEGVLEAGTVVTVRVAALPPD
jgi:hypothetical protein